jgi:sulfur carrier protein
MLRKNWATDGKLRDGRVPVVRLTVNGETYEHNGDGRVATLLAECKAPDKRVAVLVNDRAVARRERAETRLNEGDRVEIVVLAGGG